MAKLSYAQEAVFASLSEIWRWKPLNLKAFAKEEPSSEMAPFAPFGRIPSLSPTFTTQGETK